MNWAECDSLGTDGNQRYVLCMRWMGNGEMLATCHALCVISIIAELIFITWGTATSKLKLLSVKYKLYFAWNLPRYDTFCQHPLHPVSVRSIFIASSHPCIGLPDGCFPSGGICVSPQSWYCMPLSCDILRYLSNLLLNSLHCLCRFKHLSKKHPRTSSQTWHSQKCQLQVTTARHDTDIVLADVGAGLRI